MGKAAQYYRDYEGDDGYAAAQRKVREGSIHIGKPTLKPDEALQIIDNGTRYAIVEATMSTFKANISARRVGAIGRHGTIKRTVTFQAPNIEAASKAAIDKAYEAGDIEHVRVINIKVQS